MKVQLMLFFQRAFKILVQDFRGLDISTLASFTQPSLLIIYILFSEAPSQKNLSPLTCRNEPRKKFFIMIFTTKLNSGPL